MIKVAVYWYEICAAVVVNIFCDITHMLALEQVLQGIVFQPGVGMVLVKRL